MIALPSSKTSRQSVSPSPSYLCRTKEYRHPRFNSRLNACILALSLSDNSNSAISMFMLLSSWHSHCKSSPGLFDQCQGRIQKYGLGGVKGWGLIPSLPLGSPSLSRPLPSPPFSFPSPPPLEVGPLIQLGGLGRAVSSPSGV